MSSSKLPLLLEKWSEVALAKDWVSGWVEGAIYPREMVFFMARCDDLGISCIIESGRQDGFSTLILGEYARRQGIRVYSIDYEADRQRAQRCRERLKNYPELHILRGDANVLIGKTVAENSSERIALLVDGPKEYWAMSLMFAASAWNAVKLLALHNLEEGYPARTFFEERAEGPVFYEMFPAEAAGFWEKLGVRETAFCESVRARRSLERSSLGVMEIGESVRGNLTTGFHRKFKLFQPPIVRFLWERGVFRPTNYLYDFSLRFLR